MTYSVVDREHDGHSTVQTAILHLSLSRVGIKDGNEGGVFRLGGGVHAAPHLHEQTSRGGGGGGGGKDEKKTKNENNAIHVTIHKTSRVKGFHQVIVISMAELCEELKTAKNKKLV